MASSAPALPRRPLLTPKPDPDAPPGRKTALTPKPDPDAPQDLTTVLTPELCAAFRRELEPSPDDDPDFARHLRLAQQRLSAVASQLGRAPVGKVSSTTCADAPLPPPPRLPAPDAPLPQPPPPPPSAGRARGAASSSTAKGKRRARGGEMVRATVQDDHIRARSLVRRTRLTFEALRGVYLQQEYGGVRNRVDLRAMSTMISRGLCLYRDLRIVGPVPGVFVGDVFNYRTELCVVGLHNHQQAGIGYVPASLVSEGHPVATSIVSSGGYLDDQDSGDVLTYTGSGGRQPHRVEHDSDQAFERGNLALAYSYKYDVEVRVVRCHDCEASPSGKLYVYDGLYKVANSTYGPGKSGHDVCKFTLLRLPGQDELGSKTWHSAKQLKAALGAKIRPRGYITLDLSKGKELIRVPVFNNVDQDRSPLDFKYLARRSELPACTVPGPAKRQKGGCHCGPACSGSSSCVCVRKNGGGPVYNADGTLIRGRPLVYECGAHCGCSMGCPNRATQRGMKHRLEVFRSRETEWGVRTLDLIQPGAFVCEYNGNMVAVDSHSGGMVDWGGFVDPRRFPERWREWGDASAALPDDKSPKLPRFQGPGYVLDVSRRRNFAAYISHSGAPNVFVQYVVRGGENEACPHLMVFAMDTIPPMRELSIDYGID